MPANTPSKGGVAWARTTMTDRFTDRESIYAKVMPSTPTAGPLTPSRGNMSERESYWERTGKTPGKTPSKTPSKSPAAFKATTPAKPTPTFASTTDRFTVNGTMYASALAAGPGVGDYNPEHSAAKVRGAVKLQAAVRRRQSRGLFAQLERFDAGNPGSIYKKAVGEPQLAALDTEQAATLAARDTMTAAFRSETDRFCDGTLSSIYFATEAKTPGVGLYESAAALDHLQQSAAAADAAAAAGATFKSTTDRFYMTDSYVPKELAWVPGVGEYHPEVLAAKVRGAVKLQAAVRRRQSRGIFAQLEAQAKQVPGPGFYAPVTLPELRKAKVTFNGKDVVSHYAHTNSPAPPVPPPPPPPPPAAEEQGDGNAEKNPSAEMERDGAFRFRRSSATSVASSVTSEKRTAAAFVDSLAAAFETVAAPLPAATPVVASFDTAPEPPPRKAPAPAPSPLKAMQSPGRPPSFSKALSLDSLYDDADESDAPAPTATLPTLAPSDAASVAAPAVPLGIVAEDAELASFPAPQPYVDFAVFEAASTSDARDSSSRLSTASARLSTASNVSAAADGEWLFSQLERMTEVTKEDYYDASEGWDLDGLRSDLQIHIGDVEM